MQELVKSLAEDFSIEKLSELLLSKNPNFTIYQPPERKYDYEDDYFSEVYKVAEGKLNDGKAFHVFAIKTSGELKERTSKKKQYEFGRRILKDNYIQSGFFVFYDDNKNFRFSLIYTIPKGTKAEYSYYKRYTYYVERGKPYRTFVKALTEAKFDTLENIISAFSTLPLTREFYTEIQNWFAWALKEESKCFFPGGKLEENLIRLLTRLIFVWFLKERGLIPEEIFDERWLKDVVKDFGNGDKYYNVVLQNLFFATMNTYPRERSWTYFRYKQFINLDPQEYIKIFEKVPFINGGLFECLDDEDNKKFIDGFSENEEWRAKIPDELFFGEERKVDLTDFYGERKRVKVRGLINILKDYNFTADENSPIDVEVSLDPKLLGIIFENLLAAYNQETQTSERKATGSYYTPPEIVDFMVEESLVEYFKNKTSIPEEKIRELLSYSDEKPEISDKEKEEIIKAIDELKILDPAVGSGAFPMGILHKLVHILEKIDENNELLKKKQREKAQHEVEDESFDESINNPDYARKLYLIRNSIYGVDIQRIATQICKLRFFLSLIIYQKIDPNKENYGIRPLPHLETKFVAANILIGLEEKRQLSFGDEKIKGYIAKLKEVYEEYFSPGKREEKGEIQKEAREIILKIEEELKRSGWKSEEAEKIANLNIFDQTAKADWFDPELMFGVEDGFDIVIGNPPYVRQERIKDLKPLLQRQGYQTFTSTADLYVYFYEKGYNLLKDNGILTFISSNKWMRAKYGEKLRKFLKENTEIEHLIDFGGYRVFEQTVDTNIILFKKKKPKKGHIVKYLVVKQDEVEDNLIDYIRANLKTIPQEKLSEKAFILADDEVLALKEKIEKVGKPLKEWDVKIYRGVLTGYNEAFIIDTETRNRILANCKTEEERKRTEELIKPVLRGRDIFKWGYKWAGLWVILTTKEVNISGLPALEEYLKQYKFALEKRAGNQKWFQLQAAPSKEKLNCLLKDKIGYSDISLKFALVPDTTVGLNTTYFIIPVRHVLLKYLLGVLNSKLVAFYYNQVAASLSGKTTRSFNIYVEQLPIPPITPQNQHIARQIEELVDQILAITKSEDYPQNTQKQEQVKALEQQINKLVYELYQLTEDEINIIEGGNIS
ncbi:hypothetical protein Thal_0494 [Thermocrinis albus DSM 14484]|uniref:site-specific DNA-methyltransferase (adenine-specific) n=1 Tax=Thermocrinis albus (strain DSM 14484 / JCM 11386 / HI 11/12) TaxID=638303 RepID=D3SPP1_THEAH|nr:Eco57I restriction-modification methylase domain-containing protein [Thermocrinis albus]ADC89128.1 hypothetical protein Thal_0494 [Thermocrinis albus DSM 14484]